MSKKTPQNSQRDPLDVEIIGPQEQREEKVRDGFWPTFRKAAARIPFTDDLVASYYCALDPKTPTKVRMTLLAALAYFVVPFDMVPDFIMGFGFGDDIAVLTAAIAAVRGSITDAHRDAARRVLDADDVEDDKSAA